jgi:hypothetical protein
MDQRIKPFAYRPAALLKKDRWEGQVLGAEAGRARRVVEESVRREQEVLDGVARTEAELRELHAADRSIPLERRRILDLFLRHQHAVAALRQRDRATAEGVYAQVLQQLESKHRGIKAMENHEQRKRHEHEGEQTRAAFKAHDDAWLLRRR